MSAGAPGALPLVRVAAVALALSLTVLPGRAEACIQFFETNRVLGWSADGTLALQVLVAPDGKIDHAEILPTRYEGWKYLITSIKGVIVVRKAPVDSCPNWRASQQIERAKGPLTDASLAALDVVKRMKLVPVPAADGGAGKLRARFVPDKRYAERQLDVREGEAPVAMLPVPVWCMGSCLRDEAWQRWKATVVTVARAGDRTLYVVHTKGVCNTGDDLETYRVVAAPGNERRPPRSRCRGSGEGRTAMGDSWEPGWIVGGEQQEP
jgi:hypothetical protein